MSITIVAGPRDYFDYLTVLKAIAASNIEITEVVSGGATGVDGMGEKWAREHNIPIKKFIADWNTYGNSAGPIRNKKMAEYADSLIAIVPYVSKGTSNMIKQAKELGLRVFIYS